MNEDQGDNPRFAIISAIVLAILVAAALWYFFVFRQEPSEEALDISPDTSPAVTDDLGFAPTDEPIATAPPAVNGSQNQPTPPPSDVPTTSPTGAAEWILAAALAATMTGFVGLRRQR